MDEAPDRETNPNVRRECAVTVVYKAQTEARRYQLNQTSNKMVYQYAFDVEISFRASSGVLEFKTFKRNSREPAGTTTISFDR